MSPLRAYSDASAGSMRALAAATRLLTPAAADMREAEKGMAEAAAAAAAAAAADDVGGSQRDADSAGCEELDSPPEDPPADEDEEPA